MLKLSFQSCYAGRHQGIGAEPPSNQHGKSVCYGSPRKSNCRFGRIRSLGTEAGSEDSSGGLSHQCVTH